MRISRQAGFRFLVVLALAGAAITGARADKIISVSNTSEGFTGYVEDTGTTEVLHFTSGTRANGNVVSKVTNDDLDELVKVRYKPSTSEVTIWFGGVLIDSSTTEEDLEDAQDLFDAVDKELMASIHALLIAEEYDPDTDNMAVMHAVEVSIEPMELITPPCEPNLCDCLGCCGWGCLGCEDCYTQECLDHDLCVRTGGLGAQLGCLVELGAAMRSIIEDCG